MHPCNLIDYLNLLSCQPVKLMECFLRVAEANTKRSLETCGVLAGTLVRVFPKRNGTLYFSKLLILHYFHVEKENFLCDNAYNSQAEIDIEHGNFLSSFSHYCSWFLLLCTLLMVLLMKYLDILTAV
jgi:hypothetical protein